VTLPTFANLSSKQDRAVRSTCCNARVQVAYKRIDTTAGEQLVYSCNQCCKLYVVRQRDEENDNA
jgi:hypothetical protein